MRILAAVLVLLITVESTALNAQAPEPAGGWARWILPGEEVLLTLEGGKEVKGKFRAVSGASMQLVVNENVASYDLADIARVCRRRARHVGAATALGAGGGAVVGYILGAGNADDDAKTAGERVNMIGLFVAAGAAVGVAISFLAGVRRNPWEIVYEKKIAAEPSVACSVNG